VRRAVKPAVRISGRRGMQDLVGHMRRTGAAGGKEAAPEETLFKDTAADADHQADNARGRLVSSGVGRAALL
jgi:hypothetical protein